MTPARASPVTLLLTAMVLTAGCLGGSDGAGEGPGERARALTWSELALTDAHDHADVGAHANLTTANFEILGHDPLVSEQLGTTPPGNLCGDAARTTDGRQLAVVESRGDIAFTLIDVTDPSQPQWLGELAAPTTFVYDLALVPDGDHVVLVTTNAQAPSTQTLGQDVDPQAPELTWRSPCSEDGGEAARPIPSSPALRAQGPVDLIPRPYSLVLVSIQDPSAPEIVDQRPLAGFGHSVHAKIIEDRAWVVATALACPPTQGCLHAASTYQFYELTGTPAGARLNHLSTYQPPYELGESGPIPRGTGHTDAWIQTHPITGQTLAYLAAWNAGLVILDLADPQQPALVSQWSDWNRSLAPQDSGNTHSAAPSEGLVDGRHLTAIGPENSQPPERTPAGIVRVLDTTDPSEPRELGAWVLPHNVTWEEPFQWSPHYMAIQGSTLFVSHYHAGIWAIGLSELGDGWRELAATGVFLADRTSPQPPDPAFRWAPTAEEVHALPDGTLVTFDSNSGVYTLRFDPTVEIEESRAWGLAPAHAP